jgi:hypothetical protein
MNIDMRSRSGYVKFEAARDFIAEAKNGDLNLKGSANLELVVDGLGHIQSGERMFFDVPAIKLQNSAHLYGLVEPDEIVGWNDIEEGTLYFKLLD